MIVNIEQGSPDWRALRKVKITATDVACITGYNPWKSKQQLLEEKLSEHDPEPNEKMEEGTRLEPIARDLFQQVTGIKVRPTVHINGWAMCSTDGLSEDGKVVLEIKSGKKSYVEAKAGKIHDVYLVQCQWILAQSEAEILHFMAFNEKKNPIFFRIKKNMAFINEFGS